MLEAGLIISRFLHYAAVLILFGASLFPLYAYPSRADPASLRLVRWFHPILLGVALVAFLSGILWLASTTANMAGSLSDAADSDALWSVMRDTSFGHVWIVRLGLSIVILALAGLRAASGPGGYPDLYMPLLTGLLLVSLAGVGHTQGEGVAGFIHVGADGAHLLAAGAWLGGLLGLSFILAPSGCVGAAHQSIEGVLLRFSGMGYIVVGLLVGSGLINSWYLVGSFKGLFAIAYGQLLLLKLSLFAGMLGLAAANRFWLLPSLRSAGGSSGNVVIRLRRHVLGEQVLGLLIVSIVSGLGTLEPAASQMP
jgi:putative copper resistance protein D